MRILHHLSNLLFWFRVGVADGRLSCWSGFCLLSSR